MAVTTRQIAAHAHVSASTVSRVLNGFPHVDDKTRADVLRAARDLGYPLPESLRDEKRVRTVLLLQRDTGLPNDPAMAVAARGFEYAIWTGMQPVFERHGFTMRLERTRMEVAEADAYVHDTSISALVLMGGIQDHTFVQRLLASGIPFIVVGSHLQPLDVDCAMPDYLSGARQAVEHLAEGGMGPLPQPAVWRSITVTAWA